ncbi:MAG: hypothetical protein CMP21_08755 [Rickettsiales bacterium]|nr:hypothetical protein [Rickettsiales bacterium]|tara:strand:- start:1165 stop:1401 length:237 start_codon:yes stop_codon:yes gene_type:complete
MKETKPSLKNRIVIWFFTRSKTIQSLIDIGISEAYDLGFERGVKEGLKIPPTKHQLKKIKQNKYNQKDLKNYGRQRKN